MLAVSVSYFTNLNNSEILNVVRFFDVIVFVNFFTTSFSVLMQARK